MPPDQEQKTGLRLRNIGTRAWASGGDNPVHLAYHWFTADGKLSEPWDTFRIQLPHDVPPETSVDLPGITFRTPTVPDSYLLRWDLVEEGETWFFRQGGAPLEVAIEIADVVHRALFVPRHSGGAAAQASHNAQEARFALDANAGTFWDSQAEQVPGMWFQLDLGRSLVLDRIKIASPARGFPAGYQISLSEDGSEWQLVANKPQNWTDIDLAFAPCRARYVHVEQTGQLNWPANWMISDISVSTTEPWVGAQASHYAADAHKAIDARLETAWSTRAVKQKPDMWFLLDMGRPRQIERVTLEHPPQELPRSYVVEVSTDGVVWEPVGHSDDNWDKVDVCFEPYGAAFVRVRTTRSSEYSRWGIAEFVVWRSLPTWVRGS
jgi:hypothetical protein